MARKVVWTQTVRKQRRNILDYWSNRNKSNEYAKKLIEITGKKLTFLSQNPLLAKEGDCKVQCNPDKDWQKRDDDTEETIKLRFEVYHNETKPVLQYWKEREQLVRFVPYNGVQDIDKLVKVVEPQLKGISKE